MLASRECMHVCSTDSTDEGFGHQDVGLQGFGIMMEYSIWRRRLDMCTHVRLWYSLYIPLECWRYLYLAELRLFPRSFYVTTTDIFSNEWSDPIYFGKKNLSCEFNANGLNNCNRSQDYLGYDADLFWDINGDVRNVSHLIHDRK